MLFAVHRATWSIVDLFAVASVVIVPAEVVMDTTGARVDPPVERSVAAIHLDEYWRCWPDVQPRCPYGHPDLLLP